MIKYFFCFLFLFAFLQFADGDSMSGPLSEIASLKTYIAELREQLLGLQETSTTLRTQLAQSSQLTKKEIRKLAEYLNSSIINTELLKERLIKLKNRLSRWKKYSALIGIAAFLAGLALGTTIN